MGVIKSCCYQDGQEDNYQIKFKEVAKYNAASAAVYYQQNNFYNYPNNSKTRNTKNSAKTAFDLKVNKKYKEESYQGTVDSSNFLVKSNHTTSRNIQQKFKNDNYHTDLHHLTSSMFSIRNLEEPLAEKQNVYHSFLNEKKISQSLAN